MWPIFPPVRPAVYICFSHVVRSCLDSPFLLAYNLFSVSKASEAGKSTEFTRSACNVRGETGQHLVARGYKEGSLYYLDCQDKPAQAHVASSETWHRRFGHLGTLNLAKLKTQVVRGLKQVSLNQDTSGICEPCVGGKLHRTPFPEGVKRATGVLDLVHSDVCGKMGSVSLSEAAYFATFIDSRSHYTWVYPLKKKSDVFKTFLKWQAMVETSTGRKLRTFRTDGGGEYMSKEFGRHLDQHGVRHETTVPKNPEQNGDLGPIHQFLGIKVQQDMTSGKIWIGQPN